MDSKGFFLTLFLLALFFVPGERIFAQTWNNPHLRSGSENVAYMVFVIPPKTLDPTKSFTVEETQFIAQIYEPPLQYAYLKRPYTLEPLTASALPQISYFNAQGKPLPNPPNPDEVAYSIYDIYIRPGIFFQPHPAFAKDKLGNYRYFHLSKEKISKIHNLAAFKYSDTRELTADDYVYAIKRLADPMVGSPIYSLMSQHIIGLTDLANQLQTLPQGYVDLRNYPLEGAKSIDRYHYQIKIRGFYPQFSYWLAMPFFSPMPWEAIYFYSQKGLAENNISIDWYPVGTGPFMLTVNNPNRQMVLSKNPHFRDEFFPTQGEPGDAEQGYLQNAGKKLPLIDQAVFTLDRESIPRWNKFLQGYYDLSRVSSDSFNQAIHLDQNGRPYLTQAFIKKGIRLTTTVEPFIYFLAFNMLNPAVGGYSPAQAKLRQALNIAINQEDFISIFLNGRGIPAQGPIPPGIFGYQAGQAGINPFVYDWIDDHGQRKPLAQAKTLLAEAGYPNGKDPKTKKPLLLNMDLVSIGSPDENAQYNWYRKQFAQLGISLNIRSTLANNFENKVRTGAVEIFYYAWVADYPDPEDFLFLLYGPNGKVKYGGENISNYQNPQADQLFKIIADLPNGELRQQKINEFLQIVRKDSPWIWGINPSTFILTHSWLSPIKLNPMAYNTLKYYSVDGKMRAKYRETWNKPITWPFWLIFILLLVLSIPLIITYWRREHNPGVKRC